MIGVTGEDHAGAVKLFGQHRAEQHMRPGGAAEGNASLCAVQNGRIMSVGTANGKADCRCAVITMLLQQCGQRRRGCVAAMRVAGNQRCGGGKLFQQTFALIARARRRITPKQRQLGFCVLEVTVLI